MKVIDHITYHVPPGTLGDPDVNPELQQFMNSLGLYEIPANDKFEHGWRVRWWKASSPPNFFIVRTAPALHLVEGETKNPNDPLGLDGRGDQLVLGHLCISGNLARFEALKTSKWLTRNSGSGRIWLQFANLRVEVRP